MSLKKQPAQLGNVPMTTERAREILAEIQKRNQRPWLDDLFPKQRAMVEDKSPMTVAHPGRRGGKTHGVMAKIFTTMREVPGEMYAYLALTRGSAKRIMWEEMKRAAHKYKLPFEFREVELIVRDPRNASSCILGGADDAESIERLRGGRYSGAAIDECGSFDANVLSALIREIIRPALGDLRGQLLLTGTPSRVCAGIFYDLCNDTSLGASVHHWDVRDNTYFPEPEKWLEEERRINRFEVSSPIFRREYFGEWVRSNDALVYQYDNAKNGVDQMPFEAGYKYVMAVDFGYVDSTAFTILAYSTKTRDIYAVRSWKEPKLLPAQAAKHVLRAMDTYALDHIVGDAGGLGKPYVEEFKRRFGIPIRNAKKTDKRGAQELLNGDLKAGNVKVVRKDCAPLIDEMERLPWKDEMREIEHPNFENHCCFPPGTLICTKDGEKPIESIVPGDMAWTRKGLRPVAGVWPTGIKDIWRLHTDDDGVVDATYDHPFYVDGKGFVALDALSHGDRLVRWQSQKPNTNVPSTALVRVVRVTRMNAASPVYAMKVEDVHEYFADGILVKNCDAFLYGYRECKAWANDLDLDPEPYGTKLYWENKEKQMWDEHDRSVEEDGESWIDRL